MHPEGFVMTVTAGSILIMLSIGLTGLALWTGLRKLLQPLFIRFDEHDILWEDYSIGRGRTYRRSSGRGGFSDSE